MTRARDVDLQPRYNVAPSQVVETIMCVDSEKRLGPMRWGFVSRTPKGRSSRPINARRPYPPHRCSGTPLPTPIDLVVADR